MPASVTHPDEPSRPATLADLQLVVDALQIEMRSMAEALGLPARPSRSASSPARAGLRLVAAEGERLILKAARS